jgi:glycosyltransferase involved in cell wall biosynthesis
VLYCSFEYNWMRLIANHDAARFFDEYFLVGATSWSPPDYASFANLAGLSKDPIFMGLSNTADMRNYRLLEPVIRAVPLMACDWINPDLYAPRPQRDREIDILMVANWLPFKRHWLLFEALRRMDPKLRVVLIGRNGGGRTASDIRDEARSFGVRQELELLTNIPVDEVAAYQCNSRIATLLSDREGSCVAVTECMFADTPVAMMQGAHVGSMAHINRETGVLMRRGQIHTALEALLDRAERLTPRQWAIANISCQRSSSTLNGLLRDYCLSAQQPWTRDIMPLQWRYVPAYMTDADEQAMQGGIARLRDEHGITLTRFAYTP